MMTYYVAFGLVSYFLMLSEMVATKTPAGMVGDGAPVRLRRFFLLIVAGILVLVAGLRWHVGTDYWAYADLYETFKRTSLLSDLMAFNEPGIKGLARVASWLYDDYATYFFLASLITVGVFVWTNVKNSPSVALSIGLFVFVGGWTGSFNGVRQYLACALVFAGHRFIVARKLPQYLVTVLIASLFHVSALVMAALYLVPRKRLGALGFASIIALSIAALYSTDALLDLAGLVKGGELGGEYVERQINPLRILVAFAPVLLYAVNPSGADPEGEWFYRNMALVHGGVILAVSSSAYLARFGIYTAAFLPLILPRVTRFSSPATTLAVRAAIVVLFSLYWYVEVSTSSALNDFKWIFAR